MNGRLVLGQSQLLLGVRVRQYESSMHRRSRGAARRHQSARCLEILSLCLGVPSPGRYIRPKQRPRRDLQGLSVWLAYYSKASSRGPARETPIRFCGEPRAHAYADPNFQGRSRPTNGRPLDLVMSLYICPPLSSLLLAIARWETESVVNRADSSVTKNHVLRTRQDGPQLAS